MKKIIFSIFLLLVANINAAETATEEDPVLFLVNDEPVTRSLFKQFFTAKGYQSPADKAQQKIQQSKVANELINIMLLSNQAVVEELDQTQSVKLALEIMRKDILSKALLNKYLTKIVVSDEDRKKAHEEILKEAVNRAEYKTSHILLEDKKTANTVIKKLGQGEKFKSLAKEYSIENFNNQADDTNWVTAASQEKEITEAISALNPGEYTQQPVKTRFGWHVILVEDKRTPEVPPLAEMQSKLTQLIQAQKLREEVAKLRQSATIKMAEKKEK